MWRLRISVLALFLSLTAETTSAFFTQNVRRRAIINNGAPFYYSSGGLEAFIGRSDNSTIPDDGTILEAYDNWRREYDKGDFQQDRFDNFKVNYKTLMAANAASVRRARQEGNPEPGSVMSLNEYGDCSIEEYKNILNSLTSGSDLPFTTDPSADDDMIVGFNEATNGSSKDNSQESDTSIPKAVFEHQSKIKIPHDTVEDLEAKLDEFEEFSNSVVVGESGSQDVSRDDVIRDAYMDWCKARGKEFDESRLPIFAEHYKNAEKYFQRVGKPVKLNNYADLTAEEFKLLNESEPTTTTTGEAAFQAGPATSEFIKDSTPSIDSYLDNLGDIRTSTFGGKKEMKAEELSSLYSSINEVGMETGPQKDGENTTKEPTPLERAAEARRKAEEAARFAEEKVKSLLAEQAKRKGEDDVQEARLKAWEESRRKEADDAKEKAATFRPMSGSYLGEVAKTWESRSEYLSSLKASTEYLNSIKDLPESELKNIDWDPITGNPIIPENKKEQDNVVQDSSNSWDEDLESTTDFLNNDDIERTNEELIQIRQAAEILERRREDELAAQRAREEAQEWMRVQKKLEEQAELARQRRVEEERAIEEARKRAQELEEANRERERNLKELRAIETQQEAEEKLRADRAKQVKRKEEDTVQKAQRKANQLQQDGQEKKKESKSFFSIFSDNTKTKEEDEKVTTYRKNQEKRKEKLDKANKERKKLLDQMAEREKKAGEKKEENGILSNWFKKENPQQKQTLDIPMLTMWTRNEDGSISGCIENSPNFSSGARVTTSPVLGRAKAGLIVTTISGSRYSLGEAEKQEETATEFFEKTIQFLGSIPVKKREVALLAKWEQNDDGTITGIVKRKKGFNDGARITTSPVVGEAMAGKVVETKGGSYYRLL